MSEAPNTLRAAREQTIDRLCARFADESLSMSELERRLERARAARTRAELDALLQDLEPKAVARREDREAAAGPGASSGPAASRLPGKSRSSGGGTEERRSGHAAFAIMAGTSRKGHWKPPSTVAAVAIMGGVELDFRDAQLLEGVTEINCFAFWGGIEIVVPPDVNVESHGFAFMGGFEQVSDIESRADDDAPTIRINGFALMGGVDIQVKERRAAAGSGAKDRRLERGQE